uniref:ANK_REP_REGION domain-containing protein n=1 Tax=Macrostomum lignano TaxID=282301 RepID=A0A1I8JBZ3_9PLAT
SSDLNLSSSSGKFAATNGSRSWSRHSTRAINSTSHLLQLVGEQARVLLQDDNRRLPLCRISVGVGSRPCSAAAPDWEASAAPGRWPLAPVSLPPSLARLALLSRRRAAPEVVLSCLAAGVAGVFSEAPLRVCSTGLAEASLMVADGMAAESTAPAEAGGTVSSTAGRLLEHKSEENVSRRRHEEGRTGRRSYRPVRPEQLQRVRLWLASDHRVEATKLVQTSHQLVVQVRVHAAELSRFELGFFQGHCTNSNITASSSDLNLSSSSGKFAATNGSRSWSRHSTTSPMEPRLRVALEAADDAQLQSLCQQLDCNFELTVGGYKDWDKRERVQSVTHHVACKSHNLRCLKLLIDRFGSDCLKFRNDWDETAVQLAAEHQDDSWMELIRDTLGMSCFQDTARSGRAVAHYAAMNEMTNLSLKWLVKKLGSGCLAVPDEYGDTAVHLAAQYQSTDSMELMKRELGSDCFNQKGWLSRTAVHCAVLNPDSGASLEWLVQECGTASLTVPDETGNDAFRLAADCRSAEALQFLTTQLDIKQQSSLMESTLRKALEARDDGQLQQLIPLLRTNCQMTVGGYSYFVNRERTQPIAHHVVCKVRNLQCLKLLIEKFGPDCLTCRNDWAEIVVHLAAKHQDASWIQLVRDALSEDCFKEKTKSGKTVTHYAAMNEVNNSSLLWLVKQLGRHCLTIPDNDGDTAVHTVAEYQGVGSMELIKRELGTDCFKDLAGYRNRTVFHSAATNIGTNAVLEWLVKKFGSECLKIPDEDGNTAVLLASASQGVESMRMIKGETLADFVEKAADADRRARNRAWIASQLSMKPDSAPSQSRLRAALEKGDEELLQRLFQQLDSNFDLSVGGYKDFSKEEKTQSVAHHVVCKSRSPLCLKALINRLGAECLTCTNDCGETPVHLAAKYHTDSWMVLLQDSLKNDLLFNKKTRSGKTVTHYASMNKWLIRELGCDCLTVPDEDGNTAVHLAAQYQGVDSLKLIKIVLGRECLYRMKGFRDRTAFSLRCYKSLRDKHGDTAVHLAAQHQSAELLQYLADQLGHQMFALKNSKGENISDYVRMDKHSDRKFRKLSWLAGEKSPKQPNQPGPRPNVRKFEDGRTVRAANSMNKSNNCSTASTVQKPRTVPQPLKKPIIRSGEFGKVYTTLADQIQTAATKILAKKSLELKILEIEIRAVKDIIYPTSIRQFLKCEFLKTGGFYSLDVLVSGHSLFELIERQLNLIPQVDVAEFARQVCSGLRCLDRQRHFTAHSSALCSNIVITTDGLIKVIDFPQAVASCGLSTNPSGTNHSTAPELLGCAVFELKETQQPSGDAAMFQIPMLTLTDSAMPKPSMRLVTALSKFYRRCKEFDAKRVKNSSEMLQHSSGSTPSSTEEPLYQESWTSVRLIGRGGFGEIHEVITDKGIRCATKTLKLPIQLGDELETLEREVNGAVESEKNLRRLQHDNIVKFLDVAQPEPATLVVFMELLDGRTLENYINNKPLDEKTICSALLYMHSQEPPVIHRDINCTNIIVLVGNSRIKLIDFGLSIKLEHKSADIWAFGCSVFQMATGARPHADTRSLLKMAMKLSNDGAPALSADCSPDLQDFYSCCTAKDRTLRKSAAHLMRHSHVVKPPVGTPLYTKLISPTDQRTNRMELPVRQQRRLHDAVVAPDRQWWRLVWRSPRRRRSVVGRAAMTWTTGVAGILQPDAASSLPGSTPHAELPLRPSCCSSTDRMKRALPPLELPKSPLSGAANRRRVFLRSRQRNGIRVGGRVSPTMRRNTTSASRMVSSRLTFSPDSIGRKNPRKLARRTDIKAEKVWCFSS